MSIEKFYRGKHADQPVQTAMERLDEFRHEHREPREDDIEKPEEVKRIISLANQDMQRLWTHLGLQNEFASMDESQIHLRPPNAPDSSPMFLPIGNYLRVPFEGKVTAQFTKSLLHEIVHAYAFRNYGMQKFNDGLHFWIRRSGYDISKERKSEHLLLGFNEAMTDMLAFDFFNAHRKEYLEMMGLSEKEHAATKLGYYKFEFDVLVGLFNGMARRTGKPLNEIWKMFTRGVFTGEMMHLRAVERVFGPGSLRVLAEMNPNDGQDREMYEVNLKKIEEYFSSEDERKRALLKQTIIGQRS